MTASLVLVYSLNGLMRASVPSYSRVQPQKPKTKLYTRERRLSPCDLPASCHAVERFLSRKLYENFLASFRC